MMSDTGDPLAKSRAQSTVGDLVKAPSADITPIPAAVGELMMGRSKSFDAAARLFPAEADLLVERGVVRGMLLEGDFARAEAFLKENFASLWAEDPNIKSSIWALQFIEHIRKGEVTTAVEYAKGHFGEGTEGARFVSRDPEGYERLLSIEELFSLLCYEKVEESPAKHLLSPVQRESVGDYVNRKILALKNRNGITALEKMLKQLVLTQNLQLEKSNNLGSIFKLKI